MMQSFQICLIAMVFFGHTRQFRVFLPKFLLSAAIAGVCSQVLAAEAVVSIETDKGKIVGTLETPEGDPAPVVLLLHGFTGSRDELPILGTKEGVFSRTARLLGEAGYASLRIDFRGSGESDGKWEDTTFSGQIADAVAAVDWLKKQDNVDASRLGILGWSQGGLVASHAAAARRDDVDALILWAPVVNAFHSFTPLLGAENVAKAMSADPDEIFTSTLPWGLEIKLKASFYREFATTSTAGAVANYDGPLKVIVGANDTLVLPQPATSEQLLIYHNGEESLSLVEADHVWNAFTGTVTIDEQMVPLSLEWLNLYLR